MLCVCGSLGLRQDIAAYLSNVEADLYKREFSITTNKVGGGGGAYCALLLDTVRPEVCGREFSPQDNSGPIEYHLTKG